MATRGVEARGAAGYSKIQRAWRLRLWGRVRGPLVPPWFWDEGPVLEVLSPEQREACEDLFWHTLD